MPNSIKPRDEQLHTPGVTEDWRESYYFNFVNHDNKTSGFTTIGIMPNQKKAEFALGLFHEDKRTLYYKESRLPLDSQYSGVVSDKILTYKLVQPLKKWDISLDSDKLGLQLRWKARFPPFDFGKCSGTSWKSHFEQSGTVKGEAQFADGKIIQVCGYSQRDKSWGPRNWHIQNWFALHAQFQNYVICLRRDTVNGAQHASGGFASARKQKTVSKVSLETAYKKDSLENPTGALTRILLEDGESATIKSKLIGTNSFVKFSQPFPGGLTELFEGMALHERIETAEKGTGLIEFLVTHPKHGQT